MAGISQKSENGVLNIGYRFKDFIYRWFALLVLLYGLLGFLFYFFICVTGHGQQTFEIGFRGLTTGSLGIWLPVYAILHFLVFLGGALLLFYKSTIPGIFLFIFGMSIILLSNALINAELNYFSWTILLILTVFLWLWRK